MTDTANAEQYELWNGDAGRRWAEQAARRDQVLAPVADALFEFAEIRDGDSVLDVACGCGATTLRAARDAGPTGSALGIDIRSRCSALPAAVPASRPSRTSGSSRPTR